MGEIPVGDDELGFEVEMGDGPTEVEMERWRREAQKWHIARRWEVLFSLGPRAWSTPGTLETEKNSQHFGSHSSHRPNSVSYSSCVH